MDNKKTGWSVKYDPFKKWYNPGTTHEPEILDTIPVINNKIVAVSQKNNISISERLKHLRGRHDQRDHAWNRGMGRGDTSGGYAPGTMNQDQFMEMKRSLQAQIDSGSMSYEVGSAIWKRAQEIANQDYDARPENRREAFISQQQDSAQLADVRANDIASAAQQGQYANVPKNISDAPAYSTDINDWKKWIDSILPNNIDPEYREAIINGDTLAEKEDGDVFIDFPVKLREQAINDVSRGYQYEPVAVTIGSAKKREFPYPGDLGQTEFVSLIELYDKLDQEFGFSKWKLTENETTQNAQDTAQKKVKRNQELLLERITLAREYEKKYTEYRSIADVVKKLDDARFYLYERSAEYAEERRINKIPNDIKNNVANKLRDIQRSLYYSSKLAKDAYFNIRPVLQQLSDDIAKSDEELKLTSNGLRLSNKELDAFFDAHLGKSINPDMQQGRYYPSIEVDPQFEEEMQDQGVNLTNIYAYAQWFISEYVDARLHPTAEIKFGSSDSPVDGPNYADFANVVYMVGSSGYMTASVLLHELAHAMEKAQPELQKITDAFFMSRVAKDPILSSISDGTEYVKDDFPDWYCGLYRKNSSSQSVEILSMGMSMLFTDPVRFAKKHPEYFRFVTSALSGSWIKDQVLSTTQNDDDDADTYWNTQSQNNTQQSPATDISAQAQRSNLSNVNYSSTIYDRRLLSADAADLVDAAPKLKKVIDIMKLFDDREGSSYIANLTPRFSVLGLDIDNDEDIQIFCDLFGIFGKNSADDTGRLDFWNLPPTLDEHMSIQADVKLPNGKKIEAWRQMSLATDDNGMKFIDIINTSLEQQNMTGIGHAMMMRMTAAAQEVTKRTGLPVIVKAEAARLTSHHRNRR